MAIPTRAQVDSLVRQRLDSDPGFREKLVSVPHRRAPTLGDETGGCFFLDPRTAISDVIGMPLPEMVKVSVHEESLTDVHLVIPAAPSRGELAEADLELVAGGVCWYNTPF